MVVGSKLVKASDGLWRMWFTTDALDYWPVTNSSLWLEWRLWGSNPTGYHATNILLHACSALMIWNILRRLSIRGAWVAAMLFALHPVNVQSVAWVAQRKNTLSLLLFLVSIAMFLRAESDVRSRGASALRTRGGLKPSAYAMSLIAFLLAMLSKGSVAVLPALLLVLGWWIRDRVTARDVARVAPFFVIAIALTFVNVWFQRRMAGGERDVTFLERMLGAGGVIWFYLGRVIAPVRQAFIYPQWHVSSTDPFWWIPAPAALATTLVLFWQRHRPACRAVLFAWLWFCIALVPVMGFTDVYFMTYSLVADHYEYIAMIAAVALASAALANVEPHGAPVTLRNALAVVVIFGFAALTWKQAHLFASGETLYRGSLAINPDAAPLHNNLGAMLLERDANEEALQHLREALRANPNLDQAHNNICNALARLRYMDEAIRECRYALSRDATLPASHYSLGLALASKGQLPEARAEFEAAIRVDPKSVQARSYLAELLRTIDDPAGAAFQYREVLKLRPDSAIARAGLAGALGQMADQLLESGRINEAVAQYSEALSLDQSSAEAHNNLGVALAKAGRTGEAVEEFHAALSLDSSFAPARENLDKVSRHR